MTQQQEPAIALRGVGVKRGQRWLVRGVSWSVPAGACAAILGPNGSGKSTLARVIAGYVWATAGEVSVAGQRFGNVDLNELRRSIRLVQPAGPFDEPPELTARQVVLTGAFGTIGLYDQPTADDEAQADRLLNRVGLARLAGQAYATLSSGERVRTLIARSLMRQPRLLLLDEPTAGLDLLAREQVLATVQALFGHADVRHPAPAVLMITHHVEELPPATSNVLLLDNGEVAGSGRPEDVLREEVLSRVYRCPLRVSRVQGRTFVQVEPGAWRDLLDG